LAVAPVPGENLGYFAVNVAPFLIPHWLPPTPVLQKCGKNLATGGDIFFIQRVFCLIAARTSSGACWLLCLVVVNVMLIVGGTGKNVVLF